jgi:hypothetical protein
MASCLQELYHRGSKVLGRYTVAAWRSGSRNARRHAHGSASESGTVGFLSGGTIHWRAAGQSGYCRLTEQGFAFYRPVSPMGSEGHHVATSKEHRSNLLWKFGKPPDLVLEIVSNRGAREGSYTIGVDTAQQL